MHPVEAPAHPPLEELGGYRIVRALAAGASYLAVAPGGREVVLKMLDPDCLLGGRLHPSIRDRLSRICELAHRGVANLHGVERDGTYIYAVRDYIDGRSLEQYSAPGAASDRQLLLIARELVLAIQSLHALGLVHGAIHARNVMIDSHSAVRLTDVSPLLHHDPEVDEEAAARMLREIVERRGEAKTALGRCLDTSVSLRQLGAALAGAVEGKENGIADPVAAPVEKSMRRRALVGAAVVALTGALAAAGLLHFARGSINPLPEQPQADPAAFQSATH